MQVSSMEYSVLECCSEASLHKTRETQPKKKKKKTLLTGPILLCCFGEIFQKITSAVGKENVETTKKIRFQFVCMKSLYPIVSKLPGPLSHAFSLATCPTFLVVDFKHKTSHSKQ